MVLILDIISSPSPKPGVLRQTFHPPGGSIGRENDNSWVLPHSKVSGHHAVISYAGGVYYIEDTSRNGVYLNSSRNRLARGQPHPLQAGDRILIDPYEISVAIARDDVESAGATVDPLDHLDRFDAFAHSDVDDPFAPQPVPVSAFDRYDEPNVAPEELDPLALLNLTDNRPPPRKAPSAQDLESGSPLDAHFQPPEAVPDPRPASPADAMSIPQDYDPLAPDEPALAPRRRAAPPPERAPNPPAADQPLARPRLRSAPPRANVSSAPPPAASPPPAAQVGGPTPADLGAVLEGAGLDPAGVTPELARTFGEIIRVVVSGVMDVLQSRQQIKDEFRMRMTRFRQADNNPLKFSANVDDALHNLLVKRNAAYLGPVDAFTDAFVDLRNHQIAMLAGMRVAFESMLSEFDPDRLQESFDAQLNKSLVPAKLRYWELFRDKRHEIDKDPEASFRRLFGEAFARAYEEQLNQLKGQAPHEQEREDSLRPKRAPDS